MILNIELPLIIFELLWFGFGVQQWWNICGFCRQCQRMVTAYQLEKKAFIITIIIILSSSPTRETALISRDINKVD